MPHPLSVRSTFRGESHKWLKLAPNFIVVVLVWGVLAANSAPRFPAIAEIPPPSFLKNISIVDVAVQIEKVFFTLRCLEYIKGDFHFNKAAITCG